MREHLSIIDTLDAYRHDVETKLQEEIRREVEFIKSQPPGSSLITESEGVIMGLKKAQNHLIWETQKYRLQPPLRRRPWDPRQLAWRNAVILRDSGVCVRCGSRMGLQAHHVIAYQDLREIAFDVNNGVTLCEVCHKEFHQRYGKTGHGLDELMDFLQGRSE